MMKIIDKMTKAINMCFKAFNHKSYAAPIALTVIVLIAFLSSYSAKNNFDLFVTITSFMTFFSAGLFLLFLNGLIHHKKELKHLAKLSCLTMLVCLLDIICVKTMSFLWVLGLPLIVVGSFLFFYTLKEVVNSFQLDKKV